MTSVPLLLLDTLDDLSHEDFKRFQWLLENGVLDSCRPVARSRLEDTDRAGTVSAMTRDYGEGMAVNIGVEILKQMGNNNAAEKLRRRRAASASTSAAPEAPPAAASPVAPPADATMMATESGVIISPTFKGGNIGTVNITFNK